jgi:hypothetical protein
MTIEPARARKRRVGEDVAHQSVVLDDRDLLVLEGGHAGRLLATVLERVERVVAEVGDVATRRHDPDHAAGFFHVPSTLRFDRRRRHCDILAQHESQLTALVTA